MILEQQFKEELTLGINQILQAEEAFRPRLMQSLRLDMINRLDECDLAKDRKLYLTYLLASNPNLTEILPDIQ